MIQGTPEFGNPDHIRAVREMEREAEEKEKEAAWKTYKVNVYFSGVIEKEIKAPDAETAREFAEEDGFDWTDCEDVDIESIQVNER